jgi:aldehyde:ferredoxin oxidoreductase
MKERQAMPFGYAGNILQVDLTRGTIRREPVDDAVYRRYLGGSGLAAYLLSARREVPGPLDPDSLLVFAPGLMTGSLVPGMTRVSVSARSPLTGIWGEATAGGSFGAELRFCDLDAIVVTGQAAVPAYVWVTDEGAELRSAEPLWGLDTFEVTEAVQRATHRQAKVASIGPAGERLSRIASVQFEGIAARSAGRTGLGAVMGAKRLKAVAVKGRRGIKAYDGRGLLAWSGRADREFPPQFGLFRKYGTSGSIELNEERGSIGIRNFDGGSFAEGARRLSGRHIDRRYAGVQSSCSGCPIHCWIVFDSEKAAGYRKRALGRGPEYETLGAFGSMLLNDHLDSVMEANALANRYGMDTISLGNTIAFATEAAERGLLSARDLDGVELRWGNPAALLTLVRRIALRQGIGDLLAEGSREAARRIGGLAPSLTVEVKGLELPMHDVRAFWSSGLNYACGSRGACHLDALAFAIESGAPLREFGYNQRLSPFTSEGKALLVQRTHDLMAIYNGLGMCKFYLRTGSGPTWFAEGLNYSTGWGMTWEELMTAGERIFQAKRLFSVRCGTGVADDVLSERLHHPSPHPKHQALPKAEFLKMRDEYYRIRGWDSQGRPTPERLASLGIG